MRASLVLTVAGTDKPGLVDALSKIAASHQANWEESRMAKLAGQFVGIVHLSVPRASMDDLLSALQGLKTLGLTVEARPGTAGDEASEPLQTLSLELVGNDREGIVQEVAQVLASLHVNIDELHTHRWHAPHAGGVLFKLMARLRCPAAVSMTTLRERLEAIAQDLMVEIQVREEKSS